MDRKLRKLSREGQASLDLAMTYLRDGAPLSAAKHLREAADKIEAWGNLRNKMMDELTGQPEKA